MKKTKVFLLGGGSILQDATSNRSIFYYNYIMKMAIRCHCKTMLYANGIGPITKERNRKRTIKLLNQIDLITVRDSDSAELLRSFNITSPIVITADDAFSQRFLPKSADQTDEQNTVVGVNFKLSTESDERIEDLAHALAALAEKHHLFYYLIPYHLGQDLPPLQSLNRMIPKVSKVIHPDGDPATTVQAIASCDYHICERLIIFS